MFVTGLLTATPLETVQLQGTSGSPIVRTYNGFSESQQYGWRTFSITGVSSGPNNLIKGKIQTAGYMEGSSASYVNISDWVIPNDWNNGPYYVRITHVADDVPDTGSFGTWRDLSTQNTIFGWRHNGISYREGTVKVEISTQQDEAGIIATGYYRGRVLVSP